MNENENINEEISEESVKETPCKTASAEEKDALAESEKKAKRKRIIACIFAIIMLYGANLIIFFTIWLSGRYDDVNLDQILYQAKEFAGRRGRRPLHWVDVSTPIDSNFSVISAVSLLLGATPQPPFAAFFGRRGNRRMCR